MNSSHAQKPVITGYGVLTALGDIDATWTGLMKGKSGLQSLALPDVPNSYPAGKIATLGDDFGSASRLAALLQMGLQQYLSLTDDADNLDIIVATTKGAADELLHHPGNPEGQPWHIGKMVAEVLSCTAKQRTVSAACASGTVALIQAAKQIMTGASECVLVVGVDLLSSFVMAGFDALKGLSPTPCTPFDTNREGLSLGEGIGVVTICSKTFAKRHQQEVFAGIGGWGVSCDATHITAPSRTGSGLIRVIEQAGRQSSVKVGAINAHGTGTVYNDAMELTAFNACFDTIPPFHSVKGAIGHCLGAAGVVEAAIALKSLKEGCIPPSVGYREGDAPAGSISGSTPLPLKAPAVLTCNSGFGGINAGIIFSQP